MLYDGFNQLAKLIGFQSLSIDFTLGFLSAWEYEIKYLYHILSSTVYLFNFFSFKTFFLFTLVVCPVYFHIFRGMARLAPFFFVFLSPFCIRFAL